MYLRTTALKIVLAWVLFASYSSLPAQQQGEEQDSIGEVCFLELAINYGSFCNPSGPPQTKQSFVRIDKHLSYFVCRYPVKLNEQVCHRRVDMLGNQAQVVCLKATRTDDQGLVVHFGKGWEYGRRGQHWRSHRLNVSYRDGVLAQSMQVFAPYFSTRDDASGQSIITYALFASKLGLGFPFAETLPETITPELFLKIAAQRFANDRKGANAGIVLNLARFFPLPFAPKDNLRLIQRAAKSVSFHHGGRRNLPASARPGRDFVAEQALMNLGIVPDAKSNNPKRTHSGGSSYAGYRYFAESSRHSPAIRLIAFERSLRAQRGATFHHEWIRMIESGELVIEEPTRTQLIRSLRKEVSGRDPMALMRVGVVSMLTLLLSTFLLRALSRQIMFS